MKVLLFSGGIDSTAVAWMERPDALLFIDYGQIAAAGEGRAARAIAESMALPLTLREAPLSGYGRGTMAGRDPVEGATPEYWPFRNQMLLTLAAMTHASTQPLELLIGTVAGDAVQPDGGADFITAANAILAAQGRYSVRAPGIGMDTVTLVAHSGLPSEILGWTFSCHTGEWACGRCRGCGKHDEVKALAKR